MQISKDGHRPKRPQPEGVLAFDETVREQMDPARDLGIHIKRAYAPHDPQDGRRVLVDRLWPRGLSKHDLEDALWVRDVAPSTSLRKWFGHKPERWAEFRRRYFAELRANPAVKTLRDLIAAGPVTLIYGAHDQIHNQAVALPEYLGQPPPNKEEGR